MPKTGEKNYVNKDFTDYFLLFINNNREKEFYPAFKKLIDDAKLIEEIHPELFKKEGLLNSEYLDSEYENINFYDAIKEDYINSPISFKAIVRGEAAKPYVYPVKIRVNCDLSRGEMCASCGLFLTGGNLEIDLSSINPLELIDIGEHVKINLIKRKIGIMQCGKFKIEPLQEKYMQEIFLSPMIEDVNAEIDPEQERKEQRFVIRHAFSEGSEIIPNKAYKFYSIPVPSPKNQSLVYYIKKSIEEESNLDNFKLSEEDIKNLQIFQPENNSNDYDKIEEKLKDIYSDFSVNLSPIIRHRDDMMFACDLIFHSVLQFWFGKSFERGWSEGLIVGDTQVGKTKIASKLIKHYKLGIIQGAENSTVAGLIGGMTKFETINIMTWGLLPLNNSKLVVLDEMSGIPPQVFKEMTRIRSEGIAERTIVGGSSSTAAKVRLIWLSNPRKRSMKLYDNGCDMIRELVGLEEDISRFDFILTISSDEVDTERINTTRTMGGSDYSIKHKYLSEYCHKLLLWAWSRKANNIIFKPGVEKLILDYSIKMSQKYTPNFPLILGSTIRLKIAKLSISLAARLFSTDENGNDIIVTDNHVGYIYEFLDRIYNKPSFGYGDYSAFFRAGEDKSRDATTSIIDDMNRLCTDFKSFCLNMLSNTRITALEIKDFAKCTKDQGDLLRTKLVSGGFLIKKSGFYIKSEIFRKILKEELKKK